MSSIASTLNSLNSSLLSEISASRASSRTSNSSATAKAAAAPGQDRIDLSKASQVYQQLSALEESDPGKVKDLLTAVATKLRKAAEETTDPRQAEKLNKIADKFQEAADTGDLSALRPPSGRPASRQVGAAYGRHGGPPPPPPPSSDDDSDEDDPLKAALDEILAELQKGTQ